MTAIVIGATAAQYFAKLFGVAPYAAYALAADLVAGTDYAVGADLMGGAALTKTGTPADHGYYAEVTTTAYWSTPFTATSLVDAAASQTGCTILAVGRKAAGAAFNAVNSYNASFLSPSITLELGSSSLVRSVLQANGRISSIANDANRGSRFAGYGIRVSPLATQAFERHAGAAIQSAAETAFASQTIGSGGVFRLGSRSDVAGQSGDLSAVIFWKQVLTSAQISAAYNGLARWLNPLGVGL